MSSRNWDKVVLKNDKAFKEYIKVSRPSPTGSLSEIIICPDCSPPIEALLSNIASATYLSPTAVSIFLKLFFSIAVLNPKLDITVETTTSLLSWLVEDKYFAINNIKTSPLQAIPFSSTIMSLSASPSNAAPISPFFRFFIKFSVCVAPLAKFIFSPLGSFAIILNLESLSFNNSSIIL